MLHVSRGPGCWDAVASSVPGCWDATASSTCCPGPVSHPTSLAPCGSLCSRCPQGGSGRRQGSFPTAFSPFCGQGLSRLPWGFSCRWCSPRAAGVPCLKGSPEGGPRGTRSRRGLICWPVGGDSGRLGNSWTSHHSAFVPCLDFIYLHIQTARPQEGFAKNLSRSGGRGQKAGAEWGGHGPAVLCCAPTSLPRLCLETERHLPGHCGASPKCGCLHLLGNRHLIKCGIQCVENIHFFHFIAPQEIILPSFPVLCNSLPARQKIILM